MLSSIFYFATAALFFIAAGIFDLNKNTLFFFPMCGIAGFIMGAGFGELWLGWHV